ncbi:cytokine receptor family member b2 isoform X2 [Danio aesculapii]|nr:cytokine receptor family member b2 isoform X2 [Danio aesculapii]
MVVVKACENVTSPLLCNLTEAFSNVEETYYINVSAALGSHMSPNSSCGPFKPIHNTILEPPLVTITVCNQSLCVSLRAPAEKFSSIYKSFKYRLMVSSEDGTEFPVDMEGLENVTLKYLAPGQRYCVTVSIIDRSPPNRPPVCASTPKTANVSDAVISVIVCLLMVILMMCTPRLVVHFFCLKADLPAVLDSYKGINNVIFIPVGEPISALYEEKGRLEKEIEGEAEEDLKYEKLVDLYQTFQGSPLSIFPVSSSSDLLMNQSPDKQLCSTSSINAQNCRLIEYEGSRVHTEPAEPTASPRCEHSAQGTTPPQSLCSVVPLALEKHDSENSTDVNLFSVRLGGFLAGQHKVDPDKTCRTKDELGSYPQSPEETAVKGPTWISDERSQNSEDEDEYSGYLSRN